MVVPDPSLNTLFGKWNWVSSSGGLFGTTKTPQTEGIEISVEYFKDGSFRFYENNKRKLKGTFEFTKRKSNFSNDSAFILLLNYKALNQEQTPAIPQVVSFFNDSILFLQEECSDCFSHVYKRAK